MKQRTKLILTILSVALVLCASLAIFASAEVDGALGIKAVTLSYGDRTQMLVSVEVDNSERDNVEVNYILNGETKTAMLHPTLTQKVDGAEYPVFYTEGIAAKDMADVLQFEAHRKGSAYTPVYSEMSVAKYFYTRLYRDGVANAAEGTDDYNDAALYLAALEYGSKAQVALLDEPGVLANELCYVWSDDASVYADGEKKAVLVAPGTQITPKASGAVFGFDVVSLGGNVIATVKAGDSYAVSETVKLVPTDTFIATFEDGALYNNYVSSTLYGAEGTAVDIKDVTDMSAYQNYTRFYVESDPTDETNKAFKVINKGRSSGSSADTKIDFTNANPNGDCYIFEADIYADSIQAGYTGIQLMFMNSKGSTLTLNLARESTANGGGLYITTSGQYAVPAGTRLAEGLTLDSWINIRAEYYHKGASAVLEETYLKLYINDTLVFDGNAYYSGSNLKYAIDSFSISHYRNGTSTMYYDDISFTRTEKEYVASTAN